MKQKLLIILAFLMTWGTGSTFADEASEYSAATANITAGTYRIYALSGGTKYYLKVNSTTTSSDKCHEFVVTTTDAGQASAFTIGKATDSKSPFKTGTDASWDISYSNLRFTNQNNSSADPVNDGYLHGRNNNGDDTYRHQILYYDGTGYAIRATNSSNTEWGGSLYWGLVEYNSTPNTAGYVSSASYIWHFERVVETGCYRLYFNKNHEQGQSYLLSNEGGTALITSNNEDKVNHEHPYTGTDNRDVWYISAGTADGTYSIKNVSNDKYIQITSSTTDKQQSQSLNASSQDVCFTDYYQYIGANSTDTYRFLNCNRAKVNVWSGSDEGNQFTLLPMSAYTLTVTGLTNQSVTVENNNHKSAATNAETVYLDSRASAAGDLTVTTNYEDLTANVSSFSAGAVSVAVGYNRTFANAEQSYTVCLPFALSSEEVAAINGKFYALTSYAANTLHFEEVSSTTAYTPYLFKPSVANVNISSSSYALVDYGVQSLTTTVSENAASFIGTVAEATLKSDATYTLYGYRASDGVFVQIGTGDGAHINPCRAYIQIPGASSVKAFNVQLNDATGIEDAVQSSKLKVQSTFDLQGRRVQNPTRGLYIVNGKKVAVK